MKIMEGVIVADGCDEENSLKLLRTRIERVLSEKDVEVNKLELSNISLQLETEELAPSHLRDLKRSLKSVIECRYWWLPPTKPPEWRVSFEKAWTKAVCQPKSTGLPVEYDWYSLQRDRMFRRLSFRDDCPIDRGNIRVLTRMLKEYSVENVEFSFSERREGVDLDIFQFDPPTPAMVMLEQALWALEGYPVLDEDEFASAEEELVEEYLKNSLSRAEREKLERLSPILVWHEGRAVRTENVTQSLEEWLSSIEEEEEEGEV